MLRRSLLLREKLMLGGSPSRAVTAETAVLVQELEQVIGELTGREMTAVDDWPLPYRLYRRQGEASRPAVTSGSNHDRRQGSRQRKNLLSAQAQQDCQQAVGACGWHWKSCIASRHWPNPMPGRLPTSAWRG
ncbi:hypothetical protein ACFSQE_18760 [Vogesella fluminis]|uniref:hypothetical protein n=1 Tax=Vogesella fluminis TaxID=1069161 RepID=UPI00362F0F19